MEELVQDYSSICRFCSNSHRCLKPIFKEDEDDEILSNNTKLNPHIKITKMAEILLGITMEISDELPKFICAICFDKLMSSYEFRQKCLISIKNLKEKLNSNRQKQMQIVCQEPEIYNVIYLKEHLFDDQITIKEELEDIKDEIMSDNEINYEELKINNLLSKNDPATILTKNVLSLKTIKIADENNETTVCKICGESYKHLTKHILLRHPMDKPYACEICGKLFKAKVYLKNHFRIHLDDRRYKCKLCDKAYVGKTSLRVHMLNHNGEKKYKCQICNKLFKQSSALGTHMRIHTQERNYICEICNRSFLTNQLKKRHEILHTNEYPFKCEFCTKSFKSSGSLSFHRYNIHTKLNPYKCEICGKKITRLCDFNTHKKQHEYKII